MTPNTDPVRALIADWREEAAECHAESETPAVKRDPRAYAGFASASRTLTRCADEAEAALASAPPSGGGSSESDADLLERLGDDAQRWAREFRATAVRLGYSDMDEGWLIGWFANAIEHSSDVRRWRAEAAPPSASVGVDDALIAGAMEAAADACSRHVVCNEAITAAVEYALAQQPAGVDEARPLDDWHEDDGPVVWWTFPVNEPAWIGSPTDSDWPGYHTHWTPHPAVPPALAAQQQGGA